MTKVSELVRRALKASGVVGVGQNPLAEDSGDAFYQLNLLLTGWNENRQLVYGLETVNFTGTGAASYTVGAGQTVNVVWPSRIEAAYRRQVVPAMTNLIDMPLTVLRGQEDYNSITLKTMGTVPQCVFYDPTFPTGTLYVWPVPSSAYQIFVSVLRRIESFENLNQVISLPPVYEDALFWNLCRRLRAIYRRPEDAAINKQAKNSMTNMRKANMQIPLATLPNGLPGMSYRNGGYNIYSDGR